MVGLSVVAMAKGDPIIFGRSLTGTITEDGHIGVVGGVPYKVDAAYSEHMERVLIPEEQDIGDRDLRIPFMMHVSPVGTVDKAYYALTGHSLH
jgi:predicted S18 family serine protease